MRNLCQLFSVLPGNDIRPCRKAVATMHTAGSNKTSKSPRYTHASGGGLADSIWYGTVYVTVLLPKGFVSMIPERGSVLNIRGLEGSTHLSRGARLIFLHR